MELRIPKWNDEKFKKTLKSLEKKGAKFDLEYKGEDVYTYEDTEFLIEIYEVDNKTVYAVPGWEFVGIIEHSSPENMLRLVGDYEVNDIPSKYKTCGPECEHCHKIRDRKDTYLVKNTDTNEFKQVGKACLKSYTGLNPVTATWSLGVENYLYQLEIDEDDLRANYKSYGRFVGFDTKVIVAIALKEIKINGFKSSSMNDYNDTTKKKVYDEYHTKNPLMASQEEIDAYYSWLNNLDTVGSFEYNAKIACKKEYCEQRDIAYIVAMVNNYYKSQEKARKEQERQAQVAQSEYAGQVGDKIIFKVKECRVLYVIEPYAYSGDVSYAWRIVDTDNHIIIWKTAQRLIPDMEVKATIKSLGEYKGEKQTTVTRGKIIYIPYNDDETGKALDSLYQEWD